MLPVLQLVNKPLLFSRVLSADEIHNQVLPVEYLDVFNHTLPVSESTLTKWTQRLVIIGAVNEDILKKKRASFVSRNKSLFEKKVLPVHELLSYVLQYHLCL